MLQHDLHDIHKKTVLCTLCVMVPLCLCQTLWSGSRSSGQRQTSVPGRGCLSAEHRCNLTQVNNIRLQRRLSKTSQCKKFMTTDRQKTNSVEIPKDLSDSPYPFSKMEEQLKQDKTTSMYIKPCELCFKRDFKKCKPTS